MTEQDIRRKIWIGLWRSKGAGPVDGDYAYWVPLYPDLVARGIEIRYRSPNPDSDYAMDRVMGWQAEGADVPPFGPYANPPTPYHGVPPFPGDEQQPEPPADDDDPPNEDDSTIQQLIETLQSLDAAYERIDQRLAALEAVRPPAYVGRIFGALIKLIPQAN